MFKPLNSRKEVLTKLRALVGDEEDRITGRTTGIALETIGKAIQYHGELVVIKDHHGTLEADKNLQRIIKDVIESLGLKGFTFSRKGQALLLTYTRNW